MTRPSHQESLSLASPTDDDAPKAGWMRESGRPSLRVNSPPRETRPLRSEVHGYNLQTGEAIYPRQSREGGRGWSWESARGTSTGTPTGPLPPIDASGPRYLPDPSHPNHPSLAIRFGGSSSVLESTYYPQTPRSSIVDALAEQVGALEDRVRRLMDALTAERIANVRGSLEFTSHLLQMTGWASGQRRRS